MRQPHLMPIPLSLESHTNRIRVKILLVCPLHRRLTSATASYALKPASGSFLRQMLQDPTKRCASCIMESASRRQRGRNLDDAVKIYTLSPTCGVCDIMPK